MLQPVSGTIFLWLYWPSFNGGAVEGDQQHRAFINTYLSLLACTVTSFIVSSLVDKRGRFDMVSKNEIWTVNLRPTSHGLFEGLYCLLTGSS